MSNATFYQWCAEFGRMDASLMKRMKELEDENRRFKRIYSYVNLKVVLARKAIEKKVVKLS
jgi:putative transposase